MTREEAITKLKSFCHNCEKFPTCVNTDKKCFKALEMAIKALEQCEVWNGIHGQIVAPKGTFDRIWNDADKEEQEPKTGHWIENEKQTHVEKIYHCSECGFEAWGEWERTNYCGGCGARMSEVSNENNNIYL